MREIRFDKIGFNVLANTNDVRYAVSFKNGQLDKDDIRKRNKQNDK